MKEHEDNQSQNVTNDEHITSSSGAPVLTAPPDDPISSNEAESSSDSDDEEDESTPKKSDYELLRERNIRRNNDRLKSLGLLADDHQTKKVIVKKKPVKRKKAAGNVDRVSYPTRRSTRRKKSVSGGDDKVGGGHGGEHQESVMHNTPEEDQFTVSALFEYNMSDVNPFSSFEFKEGVTNNDRVYSKNLVPVGPRLIPPSGLNAIYSLQFYPDTWDANTNHASKKYPSWLVAAGKSGIVALWDCRQTKDTSSVLSWKAHGGRWIADAKFLPFTSSSLTENPSSSTPRRLLTAANDGTICHWDLTSNSVKTGAPKLLDQSNRSLHASGIFSMDVDNDGGVIASGSKDKTVALSRVDRFGDAYWRTDFHSAKVGCVSLSSNSACRLIVSASDDGFIAVHDPRSDSVAVKIEDSHFKPHSAVWQPGSSSVFLSAGLDETIKLWDSRNSVRPLASFHGHVPQSSGKRLKRIHRPTFIESSVAATSEPFILSGGEGSHSLSMFQLNNISSDGGLQSVFNRGMLPEDHGDAGSLAVMNTSVAVSGEGGEVMILSLV